MKAYKTYTQQLAQITHPERVTDCACSWASQVVLVVKNPPANAGDLRDMVRPLGWEDPLEEDLGTHSSILACRIPWTEEPGGLQSRGSQRVRQD